MINNKFVRKLVACLVVVVLGVSFIVGGSDTVHAAITANSSFHTPVAHSATTKPYTSPAHCDKGPGGWFTVIDSSNNYYCFGGGGHLSLGIYCVEEVRTGNNWGHFRFNNSEIRSYFRHYKTFYFNCATMNELWLYS